MKKNLLIPKDIKLPAKAGHYEEMVVVLDRIINPTVRAPGVQAIFTTPQEGPRLSVFVPDNTPKAKMDGMLCNQLGKALARELGATAKYTLNEGYSDRTTGTPLRWSVMSHCFGIGESKEKREGPKRKEGPSKS